MISSQNNQSSHGLVVEQFETWKCQTLRSRIITTRSTLLRSDLPPVWRPHLGRWFPLDWFDQTTLTSFVPFYLPTESPAALTPDETQTVIRYRLCLYRRCKHNHLLCSTSWPFELHRTIHFRSAHFGSTWTDFLSPFNLSLSLLFILISSSTRRYAYSPGWLIKLFNLLFHFGNNGFVCLLIL